MFKIIPKKNKAAEIICNLNKINKNEIEENINKTKGCFFNGISFLLELIFVKNLKIYLNIVFSSKAIILFISLSLVIKFL